VIDGTAIAVSTSTLSKPSSKESPDELSPIACERCGQPVTTPVVKNQGAERKDARPIRCDACNHGWFVRFENPPLTLRRKRDRRAAVREE
jgi:hypothetical protein